MKKIIALHGNPGSPQDWDVLKSKLPAGYELVAVDADSDDWVQELDGDDPKVLVAHSWGTYRAMKVAAKYEAKIERVILVNPYLATDKPLSAPVAALLSLPVIGNALLKASHAKSVPSYLEHMFSPKSTGDHPYFLEIAQRLQGDWTHWKRAAANKLKQQANPITMRDRSQVPGFALMGELDKASPPNSQSKLLALFPLVKPLRLAGEGHATPWTAPEKIVECLTMELPKMKIGYYPGSQEKNNVVSYMDRHLQEFPDRVALRWVPRAAVAAWDGDPKKPLPHDQITFRQFSARIASFAAGLKEIGIGPGDRVIIFLPMSLDMYTAMFAADRIGAIAVFLDSWARSHHLGASAECVGPKAMISFQQAFALVDQVPEFKSMPIRIMYGPGDNCTHRFDQLLKQAAAPMQAVESETTALITFTTGSTGKPKGANRTHRFLSAQHHALSHVIPYTEKDCDMPAFPIFSLNNLAAGVTTVLPALDLAQPGPRDPAILACQIINEKINCTTLSPSMLVGLARYCKEQGLQLTGLRRVVTGGAPISKDDVKAFYEIAPQTELWILYGSTEAEPMAEIEGRDMLKKQDVSDPEIVEPGVNVGKITEDVDYKFIKIINGPVELSSTPWSQIEVPAGEVGEFLVTGDHVCRDYYNNPDAFKSTKIMGDDGRVWHRTGDLAYLDPRKDLWLVGRVNNAVERDGKYYFPVRAEVLLKRMPFASRCAFLGLPDPQLTNKNCAVVELKEDHNAASFDFAAAKTEIRRVFAKNGIPLDDIRFVKKIPMDPRHHSKVEYGILRKTLLEQPDETIG